MAALNFTVCWLVDSWGVKKSRYTSENKKELPFSILQILDEGTRKLFLTGPSYMEDQDDTQVASRSALTTTILESAYIHQQKASTNRLGVPKTTSTSLLGLNQFKNLSKAKAIQDERKAKKVEVQLRDVGIRVVATIWKSDKNKLTQVSMTVKIVLSFL